MGGGRKGRGGSDTSDSKKGSRARTRSTPCSFCRSEMAKFDDDDNVAASAFAVWRCNRDTHSAVHASKNKTRPLFIQCLKPL